MPTKKPRILEANGVHLLGKDGELRVLLQAGLPGIPALVQLFDRSGSPRVSLQVDESGAPSVSINAGRAAVSISIQENNTAGMSVHRSDGTIAVALGANFDGKGSIQVYDPTGRKCVWRQEGSK